MNKKYMKFIASAALLAMAASCNLNKTPEFDDADAFAAFDKAAYSVSETKGTVSIPVSIASVKPMKTTVTYSVKDGSAKRGTNYELKDKSSVLFFDGESRTQNIEIDIKDIDGYDGNLTFTVRLENAGDLNLGSESVCTVTIEDSDHPLAQILGSYDVGGESYFGEHPNEWTASMMSDPEDVTVVWIDGIIPAASGYPAVDYRVYGNVTKDETTGKFTIVIPCGQKLADKMNEEEVILWSFDGVNVNSAGSVTLIQDDAGAFTSDTGFGIGYDAGDNEVLLFGLYSGGAVFSKK